MEFDPSHATHTYLSVRVTHSNPSEKKYSTGNITKGKIEELREKSARVN
jgi:hypothetical protein